MGNMVEQGSKYTDEQRHDAAIQYAVLGNMKKVAKQTGIPRTTIISWRKQDWWDELIAEVRGEKADEHRAKYIELVDLAQQVTLEKLPQASAAQASIIAATATDKVRLHDGMPTEITGQSGGTQALIKKFDALADRWDEKQAKVVKTQGKTDED